MYLSKNESNTKIFKNLNHSLIFLGQLRYDRCNIIINKNISEVYKNNKRIINRVSRKSGYNLWDPTSHTLHFSNIKSNSNSSVDIILEQVKKIMTLHRLYYVIAINISILITLNIAAQSQVTATTHTSSLCRHMFDYCATFQHAKVRFYASDMILHIDYDAAYLVIL